MNEIDLRRLDLNLLVTFDVLMAERNVTRAAERLARTQSAVSHSLARLREQVGDPLMVKVGGRMTASPFAEKLIEEVRPILRSIQRVLAPPQPFEAATSSRTFRMAISDLAPSLFPRLMARVRREAPGVTLDWIAEGPQTLLGVAEGQIDVAFVASVLALPEGLAWQDVGEIKWASFARQDHPAVAGWGAAAWARWPHVVVQVGNNLQSPVIEAARGE
ncbi:LysR family transcriptional regulator [Polaromonas sp.]|uniref:LysR family transcriptional regulator n=1 Tax=Polaromonas sp. TaxID=1869339 RepID=UPI00286A413B|nr:LysR family transcriptional regulator [Polaromonas sp.]